MQSIRGNEQRAVVLKPVTATIERTSAKLRDLMFDEIEELRAGKGDIHRAGAIAKLAGQIIASARLDVDYAATMRDGKTAEVEPLALGKK